jgi:signal transduction histidine kinase/predicted Ser/Thr protein kinase/tetratricopeptide (TPR) repeat protein
MPFKLPQMQILEELGRGTQCVVYRAVRDGQAYALKISREDSREPAQTVAVRFRREAALLARLRHVGLPRVYEVGEQDGRSYEIMELIEGPTLAASLANHRPDEKTLLKYAHVLSGALAEIHGNGLVHRDVKPQNIVITAAGIKLIDFGFAGDIARNSDGTGGSTATVGTFLYSAPEQTGMLERPVDGRADLYALGVVLFECATGQLPFRADDVGELLRLHAVATPPSVDSINPSISPAICAIVAKLLAKDPDDRYASGLALEAELEVAMGKSRQSGAATSVEISVEPPLVGRKREMSRLSQSWAQVRRGKGELVLLHGDSGTGKSRLAREVVRQAGRGVTLLRGKCSQDQGLSLSPFRQAIDNYLRRTGDNDGARKAAGEFTPQLRHLTARLDAALGAAPTGERAEENQEIFYSAVASFILALGRSESQETLAPSILLIDDIQWLDEASFQVMMEIARRIEDAGVLMLCTSRSDEASLAALDRFRTEAHKHSDLALQPLDQQGVVELISSYLGGYLPDQDLVTQLLSRTGGSPFALGEYLRAMLEAGLVRPYWGSWQFDLAGLESLSLPTDVVQLVLRRIGDLSEMTRDILSIGATIGNVFSLPILLASSRQDSAAKVHGAVTEGVQARLIERQAADNYAFVHDKVREALLARLSQETLRSVHQRIAESLDSTTSGPQREEASFTFALAQHYLHGERTQTPAALYQACLTACHRALSGYSGIDAYHYMSSARQVALECGLKPDEEQDELLARSAQMAQMYDEATECYKDAIAHAENPYRRAMMRAKLMRIYTANINLEKAYEQMHRAFIELDVPYPQVTVGYALIATWDLLVSFVIRYTGIGAGTVQGKKREKLSALAMLYEVSTTVAYFSLRESLTYVILARAIRLAERIGPSAESSLTYQRYAPGLAHFGFRKLVHAYAARAVLIAQKLGDPTVLAGAMGFQGTCSMFAGDDPIAQPQLINAIEKHGKWMSTEDFFSTTGALAWTRGTRGYICDALEDLQRDEARLLNLSGLNELQKTRFLTWHSSAMLGCLSALGRMPEALTYKKKLETLPITNLYDRVQSYGDIMMFYNEQGEYGAPADDLLERFEALADSVSEYQIPLFLHNRWLYRCYLRSSQAQFGALEKRAEYIAKFKVSLDEFGAMIKTPVMRGHYAALMGNYYLLIGKPQKALRAIERAERLANDFDAPWVRFEALRVRALIQKQEGKLSGASIDGSLAVSVAERLGWRARANRLISRDLAGLSIRGRLGSYGNASTSSSKTASGGSQNFSSSSLVGHASAISTQGLSVTATRTGGAGLRLAQHLDSLLRISLNSASVLNPEHQARTVLDHIVRILKAERAFLFVCKELDPQQELEFRAGRDAVENDIADNSTLRGYSSTVVREVRANGKAMVVSGSEQGALLGSESAVVNDLRSIMAAPVMIRGEVAGVVYLDNRLARGMFSQDDTEILNALCAHIGVALEVSRALAGEMERQALHESVGRLQSLVTNVPVILMEFDSKGICQMAAGQGIEAMIDMPADQMVGKSLIDLYTKHASMTQSLRTALSGKSFSSTVEFGEKVFEIYFRPVGGAAGGTAGTAPNVSSSAPSSVIAVAIDNTERTRAEQMLVSASKMSALGEMAGGVAHEINNPLGIINVISGQLIDMVSDAEAPATPQETSQLNLALLKKQLMKVQSTTERIAKIVKGLRTFARDARHDPKQNEKVRSIVDETVALCSEKFKAHGVQLLVEPPATTPGSSPEDIVVPCRLTEISQVLLNLCNNAYDAIRENEQKWIKIAWEADGDHLMLSVTDSGSGIPLEVLQKIFQPFFTTKAVGAGTGLGLSISKGIVDNHGGRLEYDPTCPNTRFVIVLPQRQETAAPELKDSTSSNQVAA